jgi:hypothetical protein
LFLTFSQSSFYLLRSLFWPQAEVSIHSPSARSSEELRATSSAHRKKHDVSRRLHKWDVGKAYSGFANEELQRLDRWIRNNTAQRYGPVREVAPPIVLEIAFDSVHRSTRHKSGVAMRFPRVYRVTGTNTGGRNRYDPREAWMGAARTMR